MMMVFDIADPGECYRRTISIVPQQVLALTNSRFSFEQARLIAKKMRSGEQLSDDAFVNKAFATVLCREPSGRESQKCLTFLGEQTKIAQGDEAPIAVEKDSLIAPSSDPVERAQESLVRVLLNHHEFLTVR